LVAFSLFAFGRDITDAEVFQEPYVCKYFTNCRFSNSNHDGIGRFSNSNHDDVGRFSNSNHDGVGRFSNSNHDGVGRFSNSKIGDVGCFTGPVLKTDT
jgi:hypothetical protein